MAGRLYTAVILAAISIAAFVGYVYGPWHSGIFAAGMIVVCVLPVLASLGRRSEVMPSPREMIDGQAGEVEKVSLRGLVLSSLGVHVFGALVFNLTGFADSVAPDHKGYSYLGKMIAASWAEPGIALQMVDGYLPHSFYQHLNAAAWWLLDRDGSLVLSFINAFVGTATAWVIARIALHIYGAAAARKAFILAAFFPSMVLWSSINLRDCWSWLLISSAVLAAQHLREGLALRPLFVLAASLVAAWFVRPYLLPILGVGLGLSFFVVRVRQLPYAIGSLLVYSLVLSIFGDEIGLSADLVSESRLQQLEAYRTGLNEGGSAYRLSGDISTPGGALLYLPVGVARFLLAPFPWSIGSWRQAIALPETFVWYVLLYFAIRCIGRTIRVAPERVALPLIITLVITIAYGLVEGNEGTAFRHRAQVMLILFVFAAGDRVFAARNAPRRRLT